MYLSKFSRYCFINSSCMSALRLYFSLSLLWCPKKSWCCCTDQFVAFLTKTHNSVWKGEDKMQTEYAWICNYQFIVHVASVWKLCFIKLTFLFRLARLLPHSQEQHLLALGDVGYLQKLTVPSCSNLFSIHYTYLAYIITLKLIFAKCHLRNSLYTKGYRYVSI